jgi:hypothetical protein
MLDSKTDHIQKIYCLGSLACHSCANLISQSFYKTTIVKKEKNQISSLLHKHGGKICWVLGQPFLQMAACRSKAARRPLDTAQVLLVVNAQL